MDKITSFNVWYLRLLIEKMYFFLLQGRGGSPLSPFLSEHLSSPPPAHMGSLGLPRPSLYPLPGQYPYPTLGKSSQPPTILLYIILVPCSVVDPDLVESETFSMIPKNHSGSKQLRIRNEFEVKLFWKSDKI
jgi:hypothetical protein